MTRYLFQLTFVLLLVASGCNNSERTPENRTGEVLFEGGRIDTTVTGDCDVMSRQLVEMTQVEAEDRARVIIPRYVKGEMCYIHTEPNRDVMLYHVLPAEGLERDR